MAVLQPVVIKIPSFSLRKNLAPHDRSGCEQAEKPKLSQAAKAKLGIIGYGIQPRSGCGVMNVASERQRDPHVDVREKE
jgi:hypothetical protein